MVIWLKHLVVGSSVITLKSEINNSGINGMVRLAVLSVAVVLAIASGGVAVAQSEGTLTFEIPAQPVETALLAYSEQANIQLIVDAATVIGKASSGVVGNMDAASALDEILVDTGLGYEFLSAGTVTIFENEVPDSISEPEDNGGVGDDQQSGRSLIGASNTIEEIVITAEKREKSLQRSAVSVTAYTADHLERSQIEDIYDIGLQTPGLIVNKEIVGKIYIRGIGTENLTLGGDPGVPVHVDGAYIARTSSANFELSDVERVEVLRGPQGTLYGRNATGGSINIISKAPTEDFTGRFDALYGNFDRLRFSGAVSGPIVEDRALFRASFLVSDRDGFTPNLFTGERLDDESLAAGRLRLRLLPTENVTVDLIAEISDDDSSPQPFKQLEFSDLFEGTLGAFDPSGLRPVSQDSPVTESQEQFGFTGIINWDLGPVILTSVSAYRDVDFAVQFDGDATDILFQNFADTSTSQQFSQELRLASSGDSRFDWLLGAYYFNDDGNTTISIPIPGFGFDIFHEASISTNAFAVFGQATYDITDRLAVTLGLRYSDEDKDADQFTDFGFIPPLAQPLKENSDALTPKFGVEFFPREDVMLYASATRGFKSGGFTFNGFQSNFDPEFVWAYEGGVKSQFLDDRVQANLSFFYYDYTDLQVSKLENNTGVITNAADATIYGSEIELAFSPVSGLDINVGLSFLNAEFDVFLTEDPSNPGLGTIDLDGRRLPRSPKFTANVGGQYTHAIGNSGDVTYRLDYQHQSKSFFTTFNRDLSAQQAFDLLNARVTFEPTGRNWRLSGFVKNAFDEEYFLNILESGVETGKPEGFLAAPRTYGVQVSVDF